SARAAPGAAAPVATTGARPRTGLYRAAAGAAAVVVVLLVVLLYTRAGDVDDAVPGGGDADTPAQTAAATGVEDPPGGATETPDPPPGDATAQDPPPSPPPAGGGGARESADAAGAGTNTQPVTPGPDPTLAVRQDSLLLWRQFERLDAVDLPESTLTAIVDSARTVYGRSAAPAPLRAFAAYIVGLASVATCVLAACACWPEPEDTYTPVRSVHHDHSRA